MRAAIRCMCGLYTLLFLVCNGSLRHRSRGAIFDCHAGTGGLPYLDAVLPAEDRLAATRVVRDLGTLPPDAILYLLAQPLLDLASDHLVRDRDLTARYEARFEVEDSDEWIAAMADYNREADAITAALFRAEGEPGLAHLYLTDRRSFDRRMERGRQCFFGPPTGAHAAYLRSKGIID